MRGDEEVAGEEVTGDVRRDAVGSRILVAWRVSGAEGSGSSWLRLTAVRAFRTKAREQVRAHGGHAPPLPELAIRKQAEFHGRDLRASWCLDAHPAQMGPGAQPHSLGLEQGRHAHPGQGCGKEDQVQARLAPPCGRGHRCACSRRCLDARLRGLGRHEFGVPRSRQRLEWLPRGQHAGKLRRRRCRRSLRVSRWGGVFCLAEGGGKSVASLWHVFDMCGKRGANCVTRQWQTFQHSKGRVPPQKKEMPRPEAEDRQRLHHHQRQGERHEGRSAN